jgi:transcriptional regulator with XRE-family HTH domain
MKNHWTERSLKDYLFRIAADFIAQLEEKMESQNITQDKLAASLGKTKGRVSQVLNHPGNITLANIIKLARTLGMKVSIVAYEDDDPENKRGPINSEVFKICWEKSGKPRDFWAFQEISKPEKTATNTIGNVIFPSQPNLLNVPLGMATSRISGQDFEIIPEYRILRTATTEAGKIQNQNQLSVNYQ